MIPQKSQETDFQIQFQPVWWEGHETFNNNINSACISLWGLDFTDWHVKGQLYSRCRSELKGFGGINLPLRGLVFMGCCQT